MAAKENAEFQEAVWEFYHERGRHDLPWRTAETDGRFDPYKILVSEIMLQQTQVTRVASKYRELLAAFPDVRALAAAPLGEVLRVWNGLGYNRRAKFLWQAAQQIVAESAGEFPQEISELVKLPGVGPNTAGAIMAYAFNQPAPFVETNIRTVFIYYFFADQNGISDKAMLDLAAQTLDVKNPREWFWALMDYGAYLKQTVGNLNQASKSYAKQSKFAGSRRQLRGQIIRRLMDGPLAKSKLGIADGRLDAVLDELCAEGLIQKVGRCYSLFA